MDAQTKADVITAIQMRINFIETNDCLMSAIDAQAYNNSLPRNDPRPRRARINVLTRDQHALRVKLEAAIVELSK